MQNAASLGVREAASSRLGVWAAASAGLGVRAAASALQGEEGKVSPQHESSRTQSTLPLKEDYREGGGRDLVDKPRTRPGPRPAATGGWDSMTPEDSLR